MKKNELQEKKDKEEKKPVFLSSYYLILSFLFAAAITFVIYFNYQPTFLDYKVGDIAKEDIKAPARLKIENEEATSRMKKEVIKKTPLVYDYIPDAKQIALSSSKKLFSYLESIKENRQIIQEKFSVEISPEVSKLLRNRNQLNKIRNEINDIINYIYEKNVLLDKEKLKEKGKKQVVFFKNSNQQRTKLDKVWGTSKINQYISNYMKSKNSPDYSIEFVKNIFNSIYVPMYIENETKTEQLKKTRVENISPVYNIVKKDKIIVRNGDEIDEDTFEILQELKKYQQTNRNSVTIIIGSFLLIFLLLLLKSFIIKDFKYKYLTNKKLFIIIMVNLLLFIIIYRAYFLFGGLTENGGITFSLFSDSSIHFLIPSQSGGILLTFLININVAFLFIALLSIIVGLFLAKSYFIMFFVFISSLISALVVKSLKEDVRNIFIKVSLFALLPTSILLILFKHALYVQSYNLSNLYASILASFIGALTTAIIVSALTPVEESIFGILSNLKLLELSNMDLPIFRKMALKAPGTYHHSLMVASLAEQAAKEINLNPALVRCQSLYHDIGKIKEPAYFIENQVEGKNIHDTLPPSTSAQHIKNHVYHGMTLGKKYNLPSQIMDAIQQHHGDSLIRFFHEKALKKKEIEDIEEKENTKQSNNTDLGKNQATNLKEETTVAEQMFRYPGPKPQTKEIAIIMLADAVEASSKSLEEINDKTIENLVRKIITTTIKDRQLEESGISLKEIAILRKSFLSTLKNIYRGRISYPGFDFEEEDKEEKEIEDEKKKEEEKEEDKKDNEGKYNKSNKKI